MEEIQVGNLPQLGWLWLIALVAALMVLGSRWKRRAALRFATPDRADHLFARTHPWLGAVSGALMLGAMMLLVACLVDLRWGQVQRGIPQKGIEVMFVLDVSRSMLAEDVTPNRLGRAKQMIKDTIDEMAGDRVGLVLFAGEARQKIPMTSHYDDFKQTLDEVGPGDLARGGSNLGEAISVANDGFLSQTNEHKAIVLLTDGEDQESDPIAAARWAREERGVRIFTIGLGDLEQGARVPVESSSGRGFLQHKGQQVWSKLNGKVLSQLATETDGAYIPAGTKQVNMASVYHGYIGKVEQQEFETATINQYEARYPMFLAPAILLVLAEIAMVTRVPSESDHSRSRGGRDADDVAGTQANEAA